MMQRIGIIIIAAIGAVMGLAITHSLRGDVPRLVDTSAVESPVRKGCLREMNKHTPNEADAGRICDCVAAEFDARGLGVTDLFGDGFKEMSRITRSCARMYGAEVPEID